MADDNDNGCIIGTGIVLAVVFISSVVVPFFTAYWPWILAVVVVLMGLGLFIAYYSRKYADQARRQRSALESQEERHRRRTLALDAERFLVQFAAILTPCLVIDSNIWMNEKYDDFFSVLEVACRKHKFVLNLFGPQFDEISNIKRATKFSDERGGRARGAIARIERFQKSGLLRISPVSINAKPGAYADPLIVTLLTREARRGIKCTFVSDDKELRIRVRQHLSNFAEADWSIIELNGIISQCGIVEEAITLNLISPQDTKVNG